MSCSPFGQSYPPLGPDNVSTHTDTSFEVASGDDDNGFVTAVNGPGPGDPLGTDVLTDAGKLPELVVRDADKKPFPLQQTDVSATLSGLMADVKVKQTFSNPYNKTIEAVYIFPLPENAAVYSMKLVQGERVIEAVVRERGAARAAYETARSSGYTAALLEQERANIFTQSVANLEPGKNVDVVIQYVQDLTYDAGEVEFVFPMTIGPRYMPGEPAGGRQKGDGTKQDTTQVPDASRISPALIAPGDRSGHDVSLEATIANESIVSAIAVPTHSVEATTRPGASHIRLSKKDRIPNRDFVLRYRTAGSTPTATLYSTGLNDGYFSLILQPPSLKVNDLVGKREVVFVVDVSGSMSGEPLALCKAAMRGALLKLRPHDTFNVYTFAGAVGRAFSKPKRADRGTVGEALNYVDALSAGGGTEMLNAVEAALSPNVEPGRNRYVFFLTDGFVGNEDAILDAAARYVSEVEKRGQKARVFGFGVGSSVNRMLIDGLAKRGKGLSVVATNREDPERGVNRFYRYIDRSVLRNVRVDFSSGSTVEMFPKELPDLFASHPVIVHGHYKGQLAGTVAMVGEGPAGRVEIPVTIAKAPEKDGWPLQDLLWARAKVDWLERDLSSSDAAAARRTITELGMAHHLITRFTSFVAVDSSRKVGDGTPTKVDQPNATPEGVDPNAAGGQIAVPPAGDDSEYGYEFSDDPLASGGFGPNDATIRVRSRSVGGAISHQQVVSVQQSSVESAAAIRCRAGGCCCDLTAESEFASTSAAAFIACLVCFAGRRARRRSERSTIGQG
ncbi:MAG: VWA domain-containing protein [Polyangiaceae bacterium]|nr:VWA domain-containing protein [Polyangiaceae bacterium]